MAGSADTIVMPALGRPFQLGMLYDCRSDSLIPGITLWDLETLQNHVDSKPQPKTQFQIIASDTIEDKASALNVTASLKASFLFGLVEVNGSAEYLNDTKTSKHQARVSLRYSTTTQFKQLSMSHLGHPNVSYPDVFDQGTATHVVTAVLYGAHAFFVFDQDVSSSENIQHIQGNLQVIIKKIPLVSIEGEGALKMDDTEKKQAEKLNCTFHGDFALENNPVTYQDAMKIYSTLPTLLGDHGEKAVPVRVWLYPLTKLDSKAAQLVREISIVLIFDVQAALEQLTELDMRCNDALKNPITSTFPEIQRKIQQFKNLCMQHRQIFQKQLAGLLPSIRGGGKKEGALVDILIGNEQSPFNTQKLNEFLDTKEQEMDYVTQLSAISKAEVVPSKSERNKIVHDPGLGFVVSFTFTSLNEEETYLSDLHLWLRTQFKKETQDPAHASSVPEKPKSKVWFEEKEICQKAQKSAKSFSQFASVNKSNGKTRFIVASVPDQANPGTSIYLYEEGELVSTNFEPPSKPLGPLIDGIKHDRVQLTFSPADYGRAAISGYRVEYRIVGQENWTGVDVNNTQETFTVTGLHANTEYQFRYAAMSKPGLSESSDMSDPAKTLPPTSPPGKPGKNTVDSSAIELTWECPTVVGEGVIIREYKVEYKQESRDWNHAGKDKWIEQRTGEKTKFCTIDGLNPETPYRFRVSAVCADGAVSDPSKETSISTVKKSSEVLSVTLGLNTLPVKMSSKESFPTTPRQPGGLGDSSRLTREPELRIILVGKTGGGKSATGNTILGEEKFESVLEATPVTQTCSQHIRPWNGRKVVVIDTPAIFDTKDSDKENIHKICHCIVLSAPGPHALVLVTQLGHFTEEDQHVVRRVQEIFGPEAMKYTIVLFTHREDLKSGTLEKYINHSDNKHLRELIEQCQGQYCAFNNKATWEERAAQAEELITKIARMVEQENGDQPFYTNVVYEKVEKLHKVKDMFCEKSERQPWCEKEASELRELIKTQKSYEEKQKHKDGQNKTYSWGSYLLIPKFPKLRNDGN